MLKKMQNQSRSSAGVGSANAVTTKSQLNDWSQSRFMIYQVGRK